jgi:transposase InsO family protein
VITVLAESYPVQLACQVLACARSSYYHPTQAGDEPELKATLLQVAGQWPTYGYRRLQKQLDRDTGQVVNHKKMRRLMRELGLVVKKKAQKRHTTNSQHPWPRYPNLVQDLEIVRPDHVWVSDITYVQLRDEWVYLAVIMDVFTRAIRGWHLSRSLDQPLTLTALQRALAGHTPEIHHSDQGLQYAAKAYTDLLTEVGAQISMAEVGEAWQNGYAERLIRTIKEEWINLSDFQDYAEALTQIGYFLEQVYMHKRIHSALGYLTPVEFEAHWDQLLC